VEESHDADALLVDAPRAPAYELCAQAGASLVHEPRGFVVRGGKFRDGFFAVGEVAGTPLDANRILEEAEAVARLV
jgi:sarcosine oxidase subunit alpha